MRKAKVGDEILFYLMNQTAGIAGAAGPDKPFTGKVVHVNEDNGRVNVMAWDANGNSFARQDVPLMQGGQSFPGGDHYATFSDEKVDPAKAAKAMARDGDTAKSKDQVKAESTRPDGSGTGAAPMATQTGDASTDPNNTAAAHMSESQRAEGRNEGNPTTGGLEPKINPGSVDNLSERDREQLALDPKAQSGATKQIQKSMDERGEQQKREFADAAKAAQSADPAKKDTSTTAKAPAKKAAKPSPAAKKAPAKKSGR